MRTSTLNWKRLFGSVHRSQLRLLILTGCLLLVGTFYTVQWYRNGSRAVDLPAEGQNQIENVATVQFCTEGDSAAVCDPASGKFSGSGVSNTVVTTVEAAATPTPSPSTTPTPDVSVCLALPLTSRSTVAFPTVTVSLRDASNGTQVALLSNQVVANDAKIYITDASTLTAVSPSSTYSAWVKVPGYLGKKYSGITNLKSSCATLGTGTGNGLILGDFNGDNKVGLTDLTTMIRAYNGGTDAAALSVTDAVGAKPTLAKVVDVIRAYNTTPTGDDDN